MLKGSLLNSRLLRERVGIVYDSASWTAGPHKARWRGDVERRDVRAQAACV